MKKRLYLAGGCFWGMERLFRSLPGVENVTAGYANGDSPAHANYQDVCSGVTGFRETVRVDYDGGVCPIERLLFSFFAVIDPETPNRQGADVGSQYQTGVYWEDPEDAPAIRAAADMEAAAVIVFAVEIGPLRSFYPAEAYHQRYLESHPGGYCHVAPGRIAALARYPFSPEGYTAPARTLLTAWREREGLS